MSKTAGIRCPHCDAPVEYDGSERYVTCSYCGSKVEVTGENEVVFRTIDEAEVQKTKTERAVRLKELDAKMAQDARDHEHRKAFRIVWIAIAAVGLIMGFLGDEDGFYIALFAAIAGCFGKSIVNFYRKIFNDLEKDAERAKKEEEEKIAAGYIWIPPDVTTKVLQTTRIDAAVDMLKAAGFNNIEIVNLRDLTRKEREKRGLIDKVVVDGQVIYSSQLFMPDTKILVQYHGLPEELETSVLQKLGAGVRAAREAFQNYRQN